MLANNPMGSRRRRRFYHRAGVVPIPGERLHEFYEVPTSFFSDEPEPEPENETNNTKPRTRVVSISTLMCRLLDIINQMIALDEKETRREQAKARKEKKALDPLEATVEDQAKVVEMAIADIQAISTDLTFTINGQDIEIDEGSMDLCVQQFAADARAPHE